MATEVRVLPNGDHELGAIIDGEFVRFMSLSAGKVSQHVERSRNLRERAEAGDELARDQIGKPLDGGSDGGKPVSKMTSDELDSHAGELGVEDYPSEGTVAEKRAAIKAHKGGEEGS